MADVDDLVARIKGTCIDGYFAAEHYNIIPFKGTSRQSAVVFQTSFPASNFSQRFAGINPFLSPELREIVKHPNDGLSCKLVQKKDGSWTYEDFSRRGLFLFHYPIRMGRVTKSMKNNSHHFGHVEPDFITSFKERYHSASVLYSHFVWKRGDNDRKHVPEELRSGRIDLNFPLLVGPREVLNNVVAYAKEEYDNLLLLYARVINPQQRWCVDVVRDNCSAIHIYDCFNKPKEVHLER